MNIHEFPSTYEAKSKQEADRVVRLAENAHQMEAGKYAKEIFEIRRKLPQSNLTGTDALIGFLISWVLAAIIFQGILGDLDINVPIILLFWIIGTLGIGFWVNRLRRKNVAARIAAVEEKSAQAREKLDADTKAIYQESAEESAAYRVAFEEEARKMSLRFAESALADQVVDWAMEHLSKVIDSADRSAHIEQVAVTAALGVHPTQILFSASEDRAGYPGFTGDVFDFEKNRCRALVSPLEQAALAHVLASKTQLAIMMKYPQDPSGSVPDVTTIEVAVSGAAGANIQYHAANLNYQAVKNW